jgi:hypothetical protein
MGTPASTKEGGQSMMMAPDVCFLPAPPPPPAGPGGIPTPYPNIGMKTGAEKTTTSKVTIRNKEVLVEGSEIPTTKGDEPGCSTIMPPSKKGLTSMKNMDKVVFKKHSGKVKMQGKGVIPHTAPTMHNSNNTGGGHQTPSQTVVSVG